MSQISPPIRVLLVAVVALLAAWMLFLRPKAEPTAPAAATPPPAATAAPTAPPAGAPPAVGTGTAPATAAPQRAAAPQLTPEALAKLPAGVARAVEQRKVLVLLLWNPRSADDRVVRRELRGVDRWGSRVVVRAVPVQDVSRYAAITRGANVGQSATVVVVDRNRKVETLVGYVDRVTIDQAVLDALRNSGTVIRDAYLRAVNATCRGIGFVPQPTERAEVDGYYRRWSRGIKRFDRRFMAVAVPGRWRGFRAAVHRDHVAIIASAGAQTRAILAADLARYTAARSRYEKLVTRYNDRMDEHHVLACGSAS